MTWKNQQTYKLIEVTAYQDDEQPPFDVFWFSISEIVSIVIWICTLFLTRRIYRNTYRLTERIYEKQIKLAKVNHQEQLALSQRHNESQLSMSYLLNRLEHMKQSQRELVWWLRLYNKWDDEYRAIISASKKKLMAIDTILEDISKLWIKWHYIVHSDNGISETYVLSDWSKLSEWRNTKHI